MTENNFLIESASVTDRGLSKKRPQNEDSFIELNENGLFAVADGVGGAQAGDVASQMSMEIIGEAFRNLKPNEDAENLMKLAIQKANEAIYQMSHDLPQLSTMATTVVALHLAGNIGTIGHVGDSRIYRLDPQGNLFRETQDHSMVEEEVRAGRMTIMQAANHPSRNIISRALGAGPDVDIDLKTIMFDPETVFLLCSDGITRHIDDFELRDLLVLNESPESICQKMKAICYERGAEDNLTAVIARVSGNVIKSRPVAAPLEEESTAASAPPPVVSMTDSSNFLELEEAEEIPTQKLEMPRIPDPPLLELEDGFTEAEPEPEPEHEPSEDEADVISFEAEKEERPAKPVVQKEKPFPADLIKPAPTVREYEDKGYELTEAGGSGLFSKILSGLVLFLMGVILGAGAFFIFSQTPEAVEPARLPAAPKTEEITLSAFENLRRTVDDDPGTYLTSFATKPTDGEDYYLLGRAYMLTGKFDDAKKAFEEAKNQLPDIDVQNGTVIENDIILFETILDNAQAREKFRAAIEKNDAEDASEGTSENTNKTGTPQ